jgi:phage antirepressor YoqD-like protein
LKAEKEARELAERNAAEKQKQIELQAPKVDFYDRVTKSDSTFDMNEVSKVLKYDKMGRNNLFKILREKGILNADNQPYQKFVAQGYFKLVEDRKIIKGKECVFPQTVVFQKGVDFINRILKEYESENKDKSNQLNLF